MNIIYSSSSRVCSVPLRSGVQWILSRHTTHCHWSQANRTRVLSMLKSEWMQPARMSGARYRALWIIEEGQTCSRHQTDRVPYQKPLKGCAGCKLYDHDMPSRHRYIHTWISLIIHLDGVQSWINIRLHCVKTSRKVNNTGLWQASIVVNVLHNIHAVLANGKANLLASLWVNSIADSIM